jgi:hypothetical protein
MYHLPRRITVNALDGHVADLHRFEVTPPASRGLSVSPSFVPYRGHLAPERCCVPERHVAPYRGH